MVMYNKSVLSVNVGHIEIATCWIPGPKGNVLLPDFLAVHVTRVTGRMRMKYYLEQVRGSHPSSTHPHPHP